MTIPSLLFKTKDGITMACNASLVWCISDARQTAIIAAEDSLKFDKNPSFQMVKKQLNSRLKLSITKHVMRYNRDELLSTKEDVALKLVNASNEELQTALEQENKKTEARYVQLEELIREELTNAVAVSCWGAEIDTVKIEGFQLKDSKISNVLAHITETIQSIERERAEGDFKLAEEEQKKTNKNKGS